MVKGLISDLKFRVKQSKLRKKYPASSFVGKRTSLSHSLTMEADCHIGDDVKILDHVSLARGTRVGQNSILNNISVGKNSHLETGVICMGAGDGKIVIGEECYIGIRTVLDRSANIRIGNFVHITGAHTGVWTHSSVNMCQWGIAHDKVSLESRPVAPVTIEDYVCIGGNCTIYPGVTIGHHAVIAPNSVVTKDVAPHTMVGGVPAQEIKKL